ncbi:MAG TPA: GAF domain-containing protein [Herpetosiphonaceae bacterium]
MNDADGAVPPDALAQAQTTIARQAEEIKSLRRRLADDRLAEDLRDALSLAATAGTIAAPMTHSRLLEMIVETAASVISARAASLFLVDEATQELTFEVALGESAESIKHFRVPLGHGIAGFVALTGQAIAVADVQNDPRHAADIAQSVGYIPQSIVCVPLLFNDQIIGVLELLDKAGADSFSPADIHLLGIFANQAAVTIEQSWTRQSLNGLIREVLVALGSSAGGSAEMRDRVDAFIAHTQEETRYQQTLELAQVVQEIALHGPSEIAACQTILRGFADYLRARPQPDYGLGAQL